jgi:hypothetical protein
MSAQSSSTELTIQPLQIGKELILELVSWKTQE